MPGKYSHSVVLADYSTRGLIVLPNEQRDTYQKSAPRPVRTSPQSNRLKGTRSSQTIYEPPSTSVEGWDTVAVPPPDTSLSADTTPIRPRADHSVEDKEDSSRPVRYSRLYNQVPLSSGAVNVVNHAEAKSAYARQQMRGHSVAPVPTSKYIVQKQKPSPAVEPPTATLLRPPSHAAYRRPVPDTQQRNSFLASLEQEMQMPNQKRFARPREPDSPAAAGSKADMNGLKKPSQAQNGIQEYDFGKRPLIESREISSSTIRPQAYPGNAAAENPSNRQTARTYSSESRTSQNTQIWNPATIAQEPNFDGFSDGDLEPSSYFDVPKQLPGHSRDSSNTSALPIQRPDSKDGSRALPNQPKPVALSSHTLSTRNDRDTPSRTTGSSIDQSSRGNKSVSSMSSVSIPHGYSHTSVTNKHKSAQDPKHKPAQDPKHKPALEQKWSLPEIREDHGFSPSIFEDKDGSDSDGDKFKLIDISISGGMGQISSGKDVSLDDAASELSAAMPPPITRFKDEEAEFNANMAKHFGFSNDNLPTASKRATLARRSSATKKSGGFFSKFRSKH